MFASLRSRESLFQGTRAVLLCLVVSIAGCDGTGCDGELPDIVLIVVDTLRADHLGLYGYDRATSPVLDALAAESTIFGNATAPSSWTLPSMASLFTWSSGTIRLTRPFCRASGASKMRPSRRISRVTWGPDKVEQAADFRIGHDQPHLVDGGAETARFAANPDIAKARNLQTSAHADPHNHGHHRGLAGADGLNGPVHELPISFRLGSVGTVFGEFGNIIAGAEGPVTSATDDDAPDPVIR